MRLLKPTFEQPPPEDGHPLTLLQLCDAGALEGGLSIATGVRPDELIGPLIAAVGGEARQLKVLEVCDAPSTITVQLGTEQHELRVDSLRALVQRLNKLLAKDASARAIAILGEWETALQLWCVDKRSLPHLLRESFFLAENRRDLSRLSAKVGVR
jgi:hypothetical protein